MGRDKTKNHGKPLVLLCLLVFIASSVLVVPSNAHGLSEKEKLKRERTRLIEIKKKSEKAKRELERTIKKQKKLKRNVGKFNKQLNRELRFLKKVNREIRYAEKLLSRYDRKIGGLEERKGNLILATRITTQSLFYQDADTLDPIFSFIQTEKNKYIAHLLFSTLNEEISGILKKEHRLKTRVDSLVNTRKYWEEKHIATEEKKKKIEKKRKKGEKELAIVGKERKSIERRYRKLEKDIVSLQNTVGAIERNIRAKRKKSVFSRTLPSGYTFPAKGRVISRFGRIKDKDFNIYIDNKGIEIKGRPGGGVRSVDDGVVVYQGVLSGFGLITVIEHSGDIFTVYGKAALYNVKVGDKVKKGQKIGVLNKQGSPVVYFELRIGGNPVNPLKYIKIPRA